MKVFCLRLMLSGSPLYALTKDRPLPVPEVDVLIASQQTECDYLIAFNPSLIAIINSKT